MPDRWLTLQPARRPPRAIWGRGDAFAFHRALPGYEPTPLVDAPAAARELGVARVLVKDESSRFGLPSFKVLGASWATHRAVGDRRDVTLVCATDGNHGRAVAWMARRLGLPATVLVPADMVAARRAAIAGEGARVEVVDGTYDEAVERAAALASDDVLVIQDTALAGLRDRAGLGDRRLRDDRRGDRRSRPTWWRCRSASARSRPRWCGGSPARGSSASSPRRPPARSPRSRRATPVEVPGPHPSVMAGLNCGRVSPVAWPVIARGIEAYAAIDDRWAFAAVELLAADGVVAGESGAAGLAGLLAFRDALALAPTPPSWSSTPKVRQVENGVT